MTRKYQPGTPCCDCRIFRASFGDADSLDQFTASDAAHWLFNTDHAEIDSAGIYVLVNTTHPNWPFAPRVRVKVKGDAASEVRVLLSSSDDTTDSIIVEFRPGTYCGQVYAYHSDNGSETLLGSSVVVGGKSGEWHTISACYDPRTDGLFFFDQLYYYADEGKPCPAVEITETQDGAEGQNEIQRIEIEICPDEEWSLQAEETTLGPYTIETTAAEIESDLESVYGSGNVSVTLVSSTADSEDPSCSDIIYDVEWVGSYANTSVDLLVDVTTGCVDDYYYEPDYVECGDCYPAGCFEFEADFSESSFDDCHWNPISGEFGTDVSITGGALEMTGSDTFLLSKKYQVDDPYGIQITSKFQGPDGSIVRFILASDSTGDDALLLELEIGTNCSVMKVYSRSGGSNTQDSNTYYLEGLKADSDVDITICHDPSWVMTNEVESPRITITFDFHEASPTSYNLPGVNYFTELISGTGPYFGVGTGDGSSGTVTIKTYSADAVGLFTLSRVDKQCLECTSTCHFLQAFYQGDTGQTVNSCAYDGAANFTHYQTGFTGKGTLTPKLEINEDDYWASFSFAESDDLQIGDKITLTVDSGSADPHYAYIEFIDNGAGGRAWQWSLNSQTPSGPYALNQTGYGIRICRTDGMVIAYVGGGTTAYKWDTTGTTGAQPHKISVNVDTSNDIDCQAIYAYRHAKADNVCADCGHCGYCGDNISQYLTVEYGAATLTNGECDYCSQISGNYVLEKTSLNSCYWGYSELAVCGPMAGTACHEWNFVISARILLEYRADVEQWDYRWRVTFFLGQSVSDPTTDCESMGLGATYYGPYWGATGVDPYNLSTWDCSSHLPETLTLDPSSTVDEHGCYGEWPEEITLRG